MSVLKYGLICCFLVSSVNLLGCGFQNHKRPSITARPASPQLACEPAGIPFYLPKPLLVISKNFHHIESPNVGLTGSAPIPDSFDSQAEYAAADLDSEVKLPGVSSSTPPDDKPGGKDQMHENGHVHSTGAPLSPGATGIPSDLLAPHTFYTYEIVFVPDMTQKYVMQIEGGAGEIRAAMSLVNGWQFTGLGPYYMKDSSTAQNMFSRGVALNLGLTGGADVINSIANLQQAAGDGNQVDASTVAHIAQILANATREQTTPWEFKAPDTWEDEMAPIQSLATDASGQAILDANGNRQYVTKYVNTGRKVRHRLEKYAEIAVYEPHVEGGRMMWVPIAEHSFDREYLGTLSESVDPSNATGLGSAVGSILGNLSANESNSNNGRAGSSATSTFDDFYEIDEGIQRETDTTRLPPLNERLIESAFERTFNPIEDREHDRRGIFDWMSPRRVNRIVSGTIPRNDQ